MIKETLDIVFWGEDSFSCIVLHSLINAGHHIKLTVTPFYDNFIYKRLEGVCECNSIPFLRCRDINSDKVRALLIEMKPDICVISHLEKLIKPQLLSIPRLGFINLHPSLLPFYRGMAPQSWPIINGEKETGVTVHYVNEGIDTGDIIIQEKIVITQDMYVSDLQNKWIDVYRYIVVDAIDRIVNNYPVVKQNLCIGNYYGKVKPMDCMINIDSSILAAYNLIRGVSMPYHGAEYCNIIIWTAHIFDRDTHMEISKKYINNGIYMDTEFGNFLRFSDGTLAIDKFKFIRDEK